MSTAHCQALKGGHRNELALKIADFLNTLDEETKKTAKIEISVICTNDNRYNHFAYIIYFTEK